MKSERAERMVIFHIARDRNYIFSPPRAERERRRRCRSFKRVGSAGDENHASRKGKCTNSQRNREKIGIPRLSQELRPSFESGKALARIAGRLPYWIIFIIVPAFLHCIRPPT
jgi:hypothetical protein